MVLDAADVGEAEMAALARLGVLELALHRPLALRQHWAKAFVRHAEHGRLAGPAARHGGLPLRQGAGGQGGAKRFADQAGAKPRGPLRPDHP